MSYAMAPSPACRRFVWAAPRPDWYLRAALRIPRLPGSDNNSPTAVAAFSSARRQPGALPPFLCTGFLALLEAPECRQATLRGFHWRIRAALLLDQVVFDAAGRFRRLKNFLPGRYAFAEQNFETLIRIRRPILAVQRTDTARILVDPCHRVHAGFDARSDVQLQHDVF